MKAIRLAHKITSILVIDRLFYPGRLFVDTLAVVARCGVLLVLYSYVFQVNDGVIHSTTFQVVAWSIFFYFALSALRLRDISREIMKDVQSGNVEVLFSKPVSYLSYRMWWQVGSGLYPFIVILLFGSLILALTIGVPATMSLSIFAPTLFAVVLLGAMLLLCLYAIVGLLAFWIEDINPVFWVVDKTIMILGGSYLPVALFPDFMYAIALYSPFGASKFVTHTVYESWSAEWLFKLGLQAGWVFVMGLLVAVLFILAKRSVSVNGG